MPYLVTLETSGNQPYIFSSNKLRDVVGASELIYRVGTTFVQKAVEIATGRYPDLSRITEKEPVIENGVGGSSGPVIELVIATSGKAILLTDSVGTAEKFIKAWSEIVVEEAPGVDALAVYSNEPIDMNAGLADKGGYMAAFRDAGKKFSILKSRRASGLSRFQRIPVVAQCEFSGFPAGERSSEGSRVSLVTAAKIDARNSCEFNKRVQHLFPNERNAVFRSAGLEDLEELQWTGVIHADGNGLGQVFTNFHELVGRLVKKNENRNATGRDYVTYFRKFSSALDEMSRNAFNDTVARVWGKEVESKAVPIVVGGDDLTAVVDGEKAIEFTRLFMEKFCEATEGNEDVSDILSMRDDGARRLGMCGGVCVTKPHFPFSASYRLAEELMQRAKAVKKISPDSIAIDFHILYDSIVTSLDDIRDRLCIKEEGTSLTAKPFAVYTGAPGTLWDSVHSYGRFKSIVNAVTAVHKEKNGATVLNLPSSQAHAIREALFSEHYAAQEADWGYRMRRYGDFAKDWKAANGQEELYIDAVARRIGEADAEERNIHFTYFLDAIGAADFLNGGGNDAQKA
ncbi:MAG: hypothetical protein LBG12_04060 [Synergistaceae bacterium]|jgi:hypothetical protein|nr:hypothetical protein [Synergistaceae bacterium]